MPELDLIEPCVPEAPIHRVLEGQTTVVTGANSGLGRAVATGFGRAGAKVAVNYVASSESADDVVREIVAAGGTAISVRAEALGRAAHAADTAEEVRRLTMFDPGPGWTRLDDAER